VKGACYVLKAERNKLGNFPRHLQAKCEQRKVLAQLRLTLAKASREVHHQVEEAVAHWVERSEVADRCTYNQRVKAGSQAKSSCGEERSFRR